MRPVEKKKKGDVVSYIDSQTGLSVNHPISDTYDPYKEAKEPLIANLGAYCSYCEAHLDVDRTLEVEHIQPKSLEKYQHLENKWGNFLLACPVCNGSPNKGNQDVVPADIHLPHKDNTYLSFVYYPDGSVSVNPALDGMQYHYAEILYKLVGFNRHPGMLKPTPSDKRWMKRLETWNLATAYKDDYLNNETTVAQIVDLALEKGYWSIWYTVFSKVPEVLEQLILRFPGTAECFDANDGYKPVLRVNLNRR